MLSRDRGHRRLPEPPTRMTGVIRDIGPRYSPSPRPGQWAANRPISPPAVARLALEVLLGPPFGLDLDRLGELRDMRGDLVEIAGIEHQQGGRPGRRHRGAARLALEQRH